VLLGNETLMKRKLFLLFAFLGIILLTETGCRMRYAKAPSYKKMGTPVRNNRSYGAKRSIWQRKTLWGKKRFGPRPHGNRGWHRQ